MRHSLLLAFAFFLTLVSACKKEDDDALSIPYVPPYRVTGVVDFTLQKRITSTASYTTYITVEYENGEQERVSLALENVPQGLHDTIRTPSGYPSYSSQISYIDSGVAPGNYAVKLITIGEKSGRREYPFNIQVLDVPNCSALVVGSYVASSSCTTSSAYAVTVQAVPSVANRVTISNLNNNGLQVYANVDCSNSSGGGSTYLTIPSQDVNGINYSGYGYYGIGGGSQTEMSLTIYQNGTGTCFYELNR